MYVIFSLNRNQSAGKEEKASSDDTAKANAKYPDHRSGTGMTICIGVAVSPPEFSNAWQNIV